MSADYLTRVPHALSKQRRRNGLRALQSRLGLRQCKNLNAQTGKGPAMRRAQA